MSLRADHAAECAVRPCVYSSGKLPVYNGGWNFTGHTDISLPTGDSVRDYCQMLLKMAL